MNYSNSQKNQAHKLRRRRLNYSTSVDDEHLINKDLTNIPPVLTILPAHQKMLNRRESVADLYPVTSKRNQSNDLDLRARLNEVRRKSCFEKYELKSPAKSPMKSPMKSDLQFLKMEEEIFNNLSEKIDTTIEIETEISQNKLDSSNSSLSTSNSNEETKFLNKPQEQSKSANQQEDKSSNLKQKIKRINNLRPQSIDNLQGDTPNCLLM